MASALGQQNVSIQYCSATKKRVTALADDGVVHVSLAFAAGEQSRTLQGYSPDPPLVTAGTGVAGTRSYDPATGRFTVEVMPGPDGVASLRIRRARDASGRRPCELCTPYVR
jgi:hypothetical protein